ncbi:MAG: GAF domain-containing protein [Flavisolibacter sp.]
MLPETSHAASFQSNLAEAIQMLREGKPQHTILAFLVDKAEEIAGEGCVSSILLLDKDGLLRNGSSPHLPYDYLTAIDGLKPNPLLGTCASAAATGNMVVTTDFKKDNKWAELRHLPLSLGFVGAWSMPIKTIEGKVIGTFGTYYREEREPSEKEIEAMNELAQVAAQVLTNT